MSAAADRITAALPPSASSMDLDGLAEDGATREAALAHAEEALDRGIARVRAAGKDRNVALAARLLGVSRDVIYDRLG